MADVHEPEVRSYNMSQIRSKNTKPEMLVRKFLHSKGYRYRLHDKNLPGKPDLVLKKYRTIILIHGCFWHTHNNCKYFQIPSTRRDYWVPKLKKNRETDKKHLEQYLNLGWNAIIIWECQLKKDRIQETFINLLQQLDIQ